MTRRGIALPLAVYALAVLAALITAVFYPAWVERQLARNGLRMRQAFAAAEAGLVDGFGRALRDSGEATFAGTVATGRYAGRVRRLSGTRLFVAAEGWSPDGVARQRLGLFVALEAGDATPRRVVDRAWTILY